MRRIYDYRVLFGSEYLNLWSDYLNRDYEI